MRLGFKFRRGGVVANAVFQRLDQLLGREIADQSHAHALGAGQRQNVRGRRLLLREIERRDIDLEHEPGAHAGAIQLQVGLRHARPVVDANARHFGRAERGRQR
jgi:hypothetical protein